MAIFSWFRRLRGWRGKPQVVSRKTSNTTVDETNAHLSAAGEQTALLQNLLASMPDIVVFKHKNGQYLGCNQSFARLFRKNPDDLIGLTSFDLMPVDQASIHHVQDALVLSDGQSHRYEALLQGADGQTFRFDCIKSPLRDSSGTLLGVITIGRDITQQTVEQQERQNLTRRLEDVFLALDDGFWEWNVVTGECHFSDRWYSMLGYQAQEMPAHYTTFRSLLHPDDLSRVEQTVQQAIGCSTGYTVDMRLRCKDGSWRWVQGRGKLVERSPNGTPLRMTGTHTDIDTQARLRLKLQEAKTVLSQIIDAIPQCVAWMNAAGIYQGCNAAFAQHHDLREANSVIGLSEWDLPQPKHQAAKSEQSNRRCMEKVQAEIGTVETLETKNGHQRPFLMSRIPLTNEDREVQGLVIVAQDLGAQRLVEDALRTSQQNMRMALEAAKAGVLSLTLETKIVTLDYRAQQIFGVSLGDSTLNDMMQMVPQEHRRQVQNDIAEQIAQGGIQTIEHDIQRPSDGALRSVVIHVWIDPTRCPQVVGIVMDVTRQRRHQSMLEEAKNQAEAANRAKSAFLAMMSHEIRTPMNGILGMADLLRGMALPPIVQDRLGILRRSGESLLYLLDDILDFAKIEADRLELARNPLSLSEVVQDAIELLRPRLIRRSGPDRVVLTRTLATQVDQVLGDAGRIRQIMVNLLGNALKFTNRGQVHLTLHTQCQDQDVAVTISVSDTGPGITKEQQHLLFQPFSQLDSQARNLGGTGLGLAICQGLAHRMRGEMSVQSELGQGTTFTAQLLLGLDPTATKTAIETPSSQVFLAVIDGHPGMRHMLLADCQAAGFSATEFSLAAEALAVVHSRTETCLLLVGADSGLEAAECAQIIGADPALAKRCTVLQMEQTDRNERSADCAGFLVVPQTPRSLQKYLHQILKEILAQDLGAESLDHSDILTVPNLPGSLKVLLVEDHPVNQIVAEGMLEQLGLHPTTVTNGQEALDHFAAQSWNLILMDCEMPIMSGYEATRQIREIENDQGRHRTPIIALTANAMAGDRERCLSAGMDHFLSKPITGEALYQVITKTLRLENCE